MIFSQIVSRGFVNTFDALNDAFDFELSAKKGDGLFIGNILPEPMRNLRIGEPVLFGEKLNEFSSQRFVHDLPGVIIGQSF